MTTWRTWAQGKILPGALTPLRPSMTGCLLPLVIGTTIAAVVGGAAFAAAQLLPRPAAAVVFGDRVAQAVAGITTVRSVEKLGPSRALVTDCHRLTGGSYLLTIVPHQSFFITGATLAPLEARWHEGEALAVEVALSGCPSLLAALLERRVLPAFQQAAKLAVQRTVERGRPAYRIWLTNRLTLIVDRGTLYPLAMRLTRSRLPGTSALLVTGSTPETDQQSDEQG